MVVMDHVSLMIPLSQGKVLVVGGPIFTGKGILRGTISYIPEMEEKKEVLTASLTI